MNMPSLFLQRLYENETVHSHDVYLRQPIGRVWHEWTWAQTMDDARRLANFLRAQGLQKGDRVAILSKNCAHWFITDFAITLAGMVSVPLYATQSAKDIEYILQHAEVKLIFVGKLDGWSTQEKAIPKNIIRVAFPYENSMPAEHHYGEIIKTVEPIKGQPIPELDDVWSIIYTSGTTGTPKGAFYTHKQLNFMVEDNDQTAEIFNFPSLIHSISYLPLAHVAERRIIELPSIGAGNSRSVVNFVESLETFNEDLKAASPSIFFAVPRIWTVFQNAILQKLPLKKLDLLLKIPFVSSLIKKKIKKQLGFTRCQLFASGAAPIPVGTLEFFKKLDILIFEGYGQTENMAYASLNNPHDFRFGSIGKPCVGADIRLSEEMEILVRSPATMEGYYKDEELTKRSMTEDGYLKSGDLGRIDEDGFIYVVGRLKEQFKTAKGEYISPVPIEKEFSRDPNIEMCCLVGSGLKQPVLLVVLSELAKKEQDNVLEASFKKLLDDVNKQLTSFERVGHIILLKDTWTPENELLTPTLKMRRNEIEKKYNDIILKSESQPEIILQPSK